MDPNFSSLPSSITGPFPMAESGPDGHAEIADDLDRLMDILAHHLQEPVRRQVTYAQRLLRSLPEPVSESTKASLTEIVNGALQLRAMLRDVLLYLGARHRSPPGAHCSAAAAFDAALRKVGCDVVRFDAEVVRGELPAAAIAHHSLTDVFRALLDNALEYRRTDRRLRIQVQAWVKDGEIVFSVTDNGIGIPAQFRGRLFRVFERLHADGGRSGTGIGLALVKKVLEAANGRIWIEDGEDGGTRICFTVPAAIG